jgi:hypothetical protein
MLLRYFSLGAVPVSDTYRIPIRVRYGHDTYPIRQLAYRLTWRILTQSIRSPILRWHIWIRMDTAGYDHQCPWTAPAPVSRDCERSRTREPRKHQRASPVNRAPVAMSRDSDPVHRANTAQRKLSFFSASSGIRSWEGSLLRKTHNHSTKVCFML